MTTLPSIESVRDEFDADVVYLATATAGLPLRRTLRAVEAAMDDWRAGTQDAVAYDLPVEAARAAYARLVGVPVTQVAVGSQVSVFAGLVAASVPSGCEVLTAEGDFTSVLFPFLAQQARGVRVREVPLHQLAESVTPETALVAVSAVQSSDGRVADLDALIAACDSTGARVLLDTTQAAGWLPVDASRVAFTVCGGYKWLLAPRGTAYLTVQPDVMDDVLPHTAGWYAGEHPWTSIYGSPLRLASDARRFDVSPVWHAWVGAAPAVELLEQLGSPALHRHGVGLANRLLTGLELPASDSAIVSLPVHDAAAEALRKAGVVASVRAGRLRLAFHVSTSEDDVDLALEVLRPHVYS